MNIVVSYLTKGILDWKKNGAKISYLKKDDLRIPLIFLGSYTKTKKIFLIASGLHLEETSGPILLLSVSRILPSMKRLLKKLNIVILPVINQRGLKYDETMPDRYLRFNDDGINYNSGWGSNSKKPVENKLVEREILKIFGKFKIVFALSLHEDSTEPGNGYLWMNRIDRENRVIIQERMLKSPHKKLLKMTSTIGFRKGQIENGFTIVNAKDDSFENFMSEILGVPTLLSEAPFGKSLARRISFHKAVLTSLPL